MPKEIERKFLLQNDDWRQLSQKSIHFKQGYFAAKEQSASVRIRIEGEEAKLNIKGVTLGIVRDEYEYSIPMDQANEMLNLFCKKPFIEKIRHFISVGEHTFEIDEFKGENEGLIVAEVELSSEEEEVNLPSWLGNDVSSDVKYYNNQLVENPFSQWDKA